jgi:coatomer subunit epsilon
VQAKLHCGVAAANMRMLRWEEVETELQDALRKDDKDPEALANLIAVNLHLGKPYTRYLTQLRMQHPNHPYVEKWDSSDAQITKLAADVKAAAAIKA